MYHSRQRAEDNLFVEQNFSADRRPAEIFAGGFDDICCPLDSTLLQRVTLCLFLDVGSSIWCLHFRLFVTTHWRSVLCRSGLPARTSRSIEKVEYILLDDTSVMTIHLQKR